MDCSVCEGCWPSVPVIGWTVILTLGLDLGSRFPGLVPKSIYSGPRHTALALVHSISLERAHSLFSHLYLCVFGPGQPLLPVISDRIRPR